MTVLEISVGVLLGVACLVLGFVALRLRAQVLQLRTRADDAEARALERQVRFESLAESLPQALWFGSSDGRTIFRNRRFAEISGQGEEAGGREGVPVSVHPDDWVQYQEARKHAIATSTAASLEVRMRTQTGPYRWWQVRVVPQRNATGQTMMWVGSFTDIHALKEAEAELRRSKERYRQILDTSHDAVVLVDRDSVIRFANETVEALFGHLPDALIGRPLSDLQPERMRAGHLAGMARYIQSGERKLDWRATGVTGLHRDGHEFPVELSFAEILSDKERMFVGFIRDLSERQAAERQREALEQRLLEARKLKAIGTLAGGIAHGINNALATILGNLQMAAESAGAESELQGCLDEIHVAARRARALVRQVLMFSQPQAPAYQHCEMSEIVVSTVAFLRGMLPDRVLIQLSCDEALPAVLVDPQQVEQVLVSLATNAADAMGDHAGRIDVRVDALSLSDAEVKGIPGLQAGPHVRIRVEDTGKGMDAETLRRVFEPFFTTANEADHAGIGLSVVHGILTAHHGAVTADSTPGQGSCFTLYFPSSAEVAVPKVVRPAEGSVHILYVDDEESLVDLMQRLLKRRGYRVTAFTDPGKALAAVQAGAGNFDFVLTDQNMPDMSGLELARALQALQPTLPVAILSGYVNESLQNEAAAAGVREVLYKENLVESLCDRIEDFVRERSA